MATLLQVNVKAIPDTSTFISELEAKVKGHPIKVDIQPNTAGLQNALKGYTKGITKSITGGSGSFFDGLNGETRLLATRLSKAYDRMSTSQSKVLQQNAVNVEKALSAIDSGKVDSTAKWNSLSKFVEKIESDEQAFRAAVRTTKRINKDDFGGDVRALETELNRLYGISRRDELRNIANKQSGKQINNAAVPTIKRDAKLASSYADFTHYLQQNNRWWFDSSARQQVSSLRQGYIKASSITDPGLKEASINSLKGQFAGLKTYMADAGLESKNLLTNIKEMGKTQLISSVAAAGIAAIASAAKKAVDNVKELDSALTDIKIITNETDGYSEFLDTAFEKSRATGANVQDVLNSTATFARLGFTREQALELATNTGIYTKVADVAESEATDSITSTLMAFNINPKNSMDIIDKFTAVGNNYAISAAGIGEALQRSAASMEAANNDLDETIALATAANTVAQNPEIVGTALKTLSARIRGSKAELIELGEDGEGIMASSKLREEIKRLSGGVDIMLDDSTYKSTYQTLKELSKVWDNLTDVNKAAILEDLGGKRQANVIASIMENFSIAEDALKTSQDAAGTALDANEKRLDSISGKSEQFSTRFAELSSNILDSELIKGVIDTGSGFLGFLNECIDKLGVIPTMLAGIGGVKAMSSFSNAFRLVNTSKMTGLSLDSISEGILNSTTSNIAVGGGFAQRLPDAAIMASYFSGLTGKQSKTLARSMAFDARRNVSVPVGQRAAYNRMAYQYFRMLPYYEDSIPDLLVNDKNAGALSTVFGDNIRSGAKIGSAEQIDKISAAFQAEGADAEALASSLKNAGVAEQAVAAGAQKAAIESGEMSIALNAGTTAATGFGSALKAQVKSIGAFISMHPYITAAVAAIAVIGAGVAIAAKARENEYKKISEQAKSSTEELESVKNEIDTLQQLQKELSNAKGNKEELAAVQEKLNSAIGSSVVVTDAEAKSYMNAKSAIEAQIDAKKRLLKQKEEKVMEDNLNAYEKTPIGSSAKDLLVSALNFDSTSNEAIRTAVGIASASTHLANELANQGVGVNNFIDNISDYRRLYDENYIQNILTAANAYKKETGKGFDEFSFNDLSKYMNKHFSPADVVTGGIFGQNFTDEEINDAIEKRKEALTSAYRPLIDGFSGALGKQQFEGLIDELASSYANNDEVKNIVDFATGDLSDFLDKAASLSSKIKTASDAKSEESYSKELESLIKHFKSNGGSLDKFYDLVKDNPNLIGVQDYINEIIDAYSNTQGQRYELTKTISSQIAENKKKKKDQLKKNAQNKIDVLSKKQEQQSGLRDEQNALIDETNALIAENSNLYDQLDAAQDQGAEDYIKEIESKIAANTEKINDNNAKIASQQAEIEAPSAAANKVDEDLEADSKAVDESANRISESLIKHLGKTKEDIEKMDLDDVYEEYVNSLTLNELEIAENLMNSALADHIDGISDLADKVDVIREYKREVDAVKSAYDSANSAAENFENQLKSDQSDEYNKAYNTYDSAIQVIDEGIKNGETNSKAFRTAMKYLTGDADTSVEDYKANEATYNKLFATSGARKNGAGLIYQWYSERDNIDLVGSGDIKQDGSGNIKWNLGDTPRERQENVKRLAEYWHTTTDAINAAIEATRMYDKTQNDVYDPDKAKNYLSKMGLSNTDGKGNIKWGVGGSKDKFTILNEDQSIEALQQIGLSATEAQDTLDKLCKEEHVITISADDSVADTIDKLEGSDIYKALENGSGVSINMDNLRGLYDNLGFNAEEQIEQLAKWKSYIAELEGTNISVTIDGKIYKDSEEAATAIQDVIDKTETADEQKTDQLSSQIANIGSQADTARLKVAALESELAVLNGKKVSVEIKTTEITEHKTVYTSTKNSDGSTSYVGDDGTVYTQFINGTGAKLGSAFATGTDGRMLNSETALVGEVEPEMWVHSDSGTWELVDHPQFVRLRRGDTIFNGTQTKQLLKNGQINSFASGIAHINGRSGLALDRGSSGSLSASSANKIAKTSSTKSNSSTSSTSSTSSNYSSSTEKDIESLSKAIDRLNGRIDLAQAKSERFFNFKSRNSELYGFKALQSYIDDYTNTLNRLKNRSDADDFNAEIVDVQKKIIELKNEMNKIAKLKFDNVIDYFNSILEFKDSSADFFNSKVDYHSMFKVDSKAVKKDLKDRDSYIKSQITITKQAVDDAKRVYNSQKKYMSREDQYKALTEIRKLQSDYNNLLKEELELRLQYHQLTITGLENKQASYDRVLSSIENEITLSKIAYNNTKRTATLTEDQYNRLAGAQNNVLNGLIAQKKAQQAYIQYLRDNKFSPNSEELSSAYSKMQQIESSITSTKESIINSAHEKIEELIIKPMEKAQKTIEATKSSIETIQTMIGGSEGFFDENGVMTGLGLTSVSTHIGEYNQGIRSIQSYYDTLAELREKYHKDENYTYDNYIEDTDKLKEDLKGKIKETYSSLQIIMNDIKSKTQEEISALQKVVNKRKEALQSKKDYYDYDKTIKDKTKDITSLQAQIAALEGIDTAEMKARRARLMSELHDAEEDLKDTKTNHLFTIETSGLDKMMDDIQDKFESFWKDTAADPTKWEAVLEEAELLVAGSEDMIKNTVGIISNLFGQNISEAINVAIGGSIGSGGIVNGINNLLDKAIFNDVNNSTIKQSDKTDALINSIANIVPVSSTNNVTMSFDNMFRIDGNVDSAVMEDLERYKDSFINDVLSRMTNQLRNIGYR